MSRSEALKKGFLLLLAATASNNGAPDNATPPPGVAGGSAAAPPPSLLTQLRAAGAGPHVDSSTGRVGAVRCATSRSAGACRR